MAELLSDSTACVSCGYNLFGLAVEGVCPECGLEIRRSTRGDLLKFADQPWLRRVLLGADLMYWGIAVSILLGLLGGFLSVAFGVGGWGSLLVMGLTLLGQGFSVACAFLLTTQEPRVTLTEGRVTWRRVVRGSAVAVAAIQVLAWLPDVQQNMPFSVSLQVLVSIGGMLSVFGELEYAQAFAARLPDRKLGARTRLVKWGLTVAQLGVGLLAVAWLLGSAFPGGGVAVGGGASPTGAVIVISILTTVFAIGYLVFGLWACRLLWRYRKAFRAVLAEAKALASPAAGGTA